MQLDVFCSLGTSGSVFLTNIELTTMGVEMRGGSGRLGEALRVLQIVSLVVYEGLIGLKK